MLSPLTAFLDDCARYDPAFPSHAQAATSEDLKRIEAVAPSPIPVDLRELWLALGVPAAPFNGPFPEDLSWGIESTVKFYELRPVPPPQDAIHLASVLESEAHFFLPLTGEDWKRPVLLFNWGMDESSGDWVETSRTETAVAPSLLSYLYEKAFLTLRVPKLGGGQGLHGPVGAKSTGQAQAQRQSVETLVRRLGFQQVPHVDAHAVFYDRSDAAMLFYPSAHAQDSIHVYSSDARERTHLVELVADTLGFHPVG